MLGSWPDLRVKLERVGRQLKLPELRPVVVDGGLQLNPNLVALALNRLDLRQHLHTAKKREREQGGRKPRKWREAAKARTIEGVSAG